MINYQNYWLSLKEVLSNIFNLRKYNINYEMCYRNVYKLCLYKYDKQLINDLNILLLENCDKLTDDVIDTMRDIFLYLRRTKNYEILKPITFNL